MKQKYNAEPMQIKLARIFSSVTLLGPPMNEKLVNLVAHLFTPEEAEIAIRLPFYLPRSLKRIARKTLYVNIVEASNYKEIFNYEIQFGI